MDNPPNLWLKEGIPIQTGKTINPDPGGRDIWGRQTKSSAPEAYQGPGTVAMGRSIIPNAHIRTVGQAGNQSPQPMQHTTSSKPADEVVVGIDFAAFE